MFTNKRKKVTVKKNYAYVVIDRINYKLKLNSYSSINIMKEFKSKYEKGIGPSGENLLLKNFNEDITNTLIIPEFQEYIDFNKEINT